MTVQGIEKILEKGQQLYYNGELGKAIDLYEENESIVLGEGFDENLKIQFYLSYSSVLVVTILMENSSFDKIMKKLEYCENLIQDKKSLELARIKLQKAIAWDYKPVSSPDQKESNLSQATKLTDEAIAILEEVDDSKYSSRAYFYRGLFFERRRELEPAEKWYKKSSQVGENHPIEKSFAVRHLGFIEMRRGKLERCRDLLEESLNLREVAGFKIGMPYSILSMGDINTLLKDLHKALEYYKSGYEYAVNIGNKLAQVIGLTSIGRTHTRLEEYEEAVPYLEDAMKLAEQIGASDLLAVAKKTLETKSVD